MTSNNGQLDDVHLALRRLLKNHCRGRERARKQADLVAHLRAAGYTRATVRRRVDDAEAASVPLDARAIFYLVRDLRLAGCPVMGSSGGMFWAATFAEFVRAKANYTSRFREMGHVARAFERIERSWRMRRTHAVPAAPAPMRQGSLLKPNPDDVRDGPAPQGAVAPGVAERPGSAALPAGGPPSLSRSRQRILFPTAAGSRT